MDLSSRETLTVPSIHNDKIRYCINYDHGFSPELYRLPSVTRFARWGSTLGDGNTMHTPWTPVPMRLLGDFCASTLHTLLTLATLTTCAAVCNATQRPGNAWPATPPRMAVPPGRALPRPRR